MNCDLILKQLDEELQYIAEEGLSRNKNNNLLYVQFWGPDKTILSHLIASATKSDFSHTAISFDPYGKKTYHMAPSLSFQIAINKKKEQHYDLNLTNALNAIDREISFCYMNIDNAAKKRAITAVKTFYKKRKSIVYNFKALIEIALRQKKFKKAKYSLEYLKRETVFICTAFVMNILLQATVKTKTIEKRLKNSKINWQLMTPQKIFEFDCLTEAYRLPRKSSVKERKDIVTNFVKKYNNIYIVE